MKKVYLLAGEKGEGKTSFAKNLTLELEKQGISCTGFFLKVTG